MVVSSLAYTEQNCVYEFFNIFSRFHHNSFHTPIQVFSSGKSGLHSSFFPTANDPPSLSISAESGGIFQKAIERQYILLYYNYEKVSDKIMGQEQLHQEDLQRIRGFRLIDDDFMNACFDENIEGTELILRIILDKPDLSVKSVKTQRVMKNLLGRDIWLDVDASDSNNDEFNIEIQRADKGADRKRARYHSSILDSHLLQPHGDFGDLPETYVIFITENDVIGGNLPIYTIERQITNMGQPFNDGEHIIYVNGADKNCATELGKLMHDFFCTNPDDMYFKQLADKVRYFKEDERGVAAMCKAMEDMRNQTAWQTKVESVLRWMAKGLPLEDIAEGEGLTLDQVKGIVQQQKA